MNRTVAAAAPIRERKPDQHAYLDNGVINSRPASPKPRSTRSQRAYARLKTKRKLIALAGEIKQPELAQKLGRCSAVRSFLTCGQHEHKKLVNFRCQFRLCPNCAERRSRELFRQYLPVVLFFLKHHNAQPVHLILTQPQIEGESAKQSRERLMKAFRKLVRSDRKGSVWNQYFKGGIWSLETKLAKHKDNTYHTHLHILAFRTKQFSIRSGDNPFRDEWRAVGGGENFKLRPVKSVEKGLREVLKYISKPLDIDRFTSDNLKDFLAMKNLRFIDTFGEFRKFAGKFEPEEDEAGQPEREELHEGSLCPDCSQPLFELRMTEDEYIVFLEGIEAAGSISSRKPRDTS